MSKLAVVLAIVAIGEGAVTLHLVRQVQVERENAQTLQARVTELEQTTPQPGATFVAVPTQPATANPFAAVRKNEPPPAKAVAGNSAAAGNALVGGFTAAGPMPLSAPDQERVREQMQASMERQRTLMRDPEYREAMRAQQKMNLVRSNPNLARDLDMTAEQLDRLYDVLAEQSLRAMENNGPLWPVDGERPDAAKMQEFQRKAMEQQRTTEMELRRTLGDAKYREWQEYQSMAGVRWEADRVRNSLASAGVPLDENLAKPLLKKLHEQQMKMMQQAAASAASSNANASGRLVMSSSFAPASSPDMLKMQEQSLEMITQHQKRQREALASVLTPEQLKVVEDEHNAEQQMQRAQLRIMRAQQEAGLLDPAVGNSIAVGDSVGFVRQVVPIAPAAPSD
jgi:ribosomal protein L12E/L44/L45/RPP1/RPP2